MLNNHIIEKNLEIEELRLQVANSNSKLTEVLNEFTDEVLTRDRTISHLKFQLREANNRYAQSNVKMTSAQFVPEESQPGLVDNFLSKYFK